MTSHSAVAGGALGAAKHYFPALSDNKLARFAAIITLYFLQGVPVGISTVAVPAWLAANGKTPVEIGVFVGIALLPWSLKPLNGILMDRFAYKPMGRRRGWILGAHGLLFGTLLTMALLNPAPAQITLLAGLCFTLNIAATFNDVAVDGMAVDIVPDQERTVLNSCMFAAQVSGISAASLVGGQVLVSGGLMAMGLIFAASIPVASALVVIFRERPGEKMLPWCPGKASPECIARQKDALLPILRGMIRATAKPTTLVFLIGLATLMATKGFKDAVAPTLFVQQLGWTSSEYSNFFAMLTLIAAGVGLVVPTLLVRAIGLRAGLMLCAMLLALLALIGGLATLGDAAGNVLQTVTILQYCVLIVAQIVSIVWAMRICDPSLAASLFAMFMAIPNFGASLWAGWSGPVVEVSGYSGAYFAVASLSVLTALLFFAARVGDERLVVAQAE